MFTGLIECTGKLVSLTRSADSAVIVVEAPLPHSEIGLGDSVSVNGVCLTVTKIANGRFCFDASPETIDRTTFGSMNNGAVLNIERAMIMGGRLDGHIVTGHVDCTGKLASTHSTGNATVLKFAIPPEYCRFLVEKGSVAVDGISLTVSELSDDSFSVVIIPHTLSKTSLARISRGTDVNIETDIIGKYVARLLAPCGKKNGLTMEKLLQNGFV